MQIDIRKEIYINDIVTQPSACLIMHCAVVSDII